MALARVVDARAYSSPAQRATITYVGRPFAGFAAHPLANPFRPEGKGDRHKAKAIERYAAWLGLRPTLEADLAALWEETGHGAKPLACWCGRWSPGEPMMLCHATLLAQMLNERFVK